MTTPSLTPRQDVARTLIQRMRDLHGADAAKPGLPGLSFRVASTMTDAAVMALAKELDEGCDPTILPKAFSTAFGQAMGSVAASILGVKTPVDVVQGLVCAMAEDAHQAAHGVISARDELVAKGHHAAFRVAEVGSA